MKIFYLFFICILLIFPNVVQAKNKVFEERYIYDASEADSKLTCRAISLLQAKRLLLEKIGTYLESHSVVKNFELTKDEIISLSAGIVKTEIIDEKWDGKTYSLTAKIEADPDGVVKAIDEFRNSQKKEGKNNELANINEKSLQKIEELKNELALIQNNLININRDYNKSAKTLNAWELFETGVDLWRDGEYNEAISVLTEAIEINPKYNYFFVRGKVYMKAEQYRNAIKDFNKTIDLNPKVQDVYYFKGIALRRLGHKRKGFRHIKKAARLGSGRAKRWLKLKGKM